MKPGDKTALGAVLAMVVLSVAFVVVVSWLGGE